MCNSTPEVRDIYIVEKRRNYAFGAVSPLFHIFFFFFFFFFFFCYLLLDFHVKTGNRISFRDKRLFEISEDEITRVDCMYEYYFNANNNLVQ